MGERRSGCVNSGNRVARLLAMTPFDLLFIIVFLVTLASLMSCAVLALRGSGDRAVGRLRRVGGALLIYLGVVTISLEPREAILTSRRFRTPNSEGRVGVVVGREGDLAFPRCCILGQGLLYRPPVVFESATSGGSC